MKLHNKKLILIIIYMKNITFKKTKINNNFIYNKITKSKGNLNIKILFDNKLIITRVIWNIKIIIKQK
jgi:hypothetical protein